MVSSTRSWKAGITPNNDTALWVRGGVECLFVQPSLVKRGHALTVLHLQSGYVAPIFTVNIERKQGF
jgi:hypothetical protein